MEYWNIRKDKRKMQRAKNMGKYGQFSLLEFSKLWLTIEAKIITLSDVVLKVCRGNTQDNYIVTRVGWRDLRGKADTGNDEFHVYNVIDSLKNTVGKSKYRIPGKQERERPKGLSFGSIC